MTNLSDILGRFDNVRALVVGDLMVDEHVWGNASRVSPEAPVLVVDVNGDPELLPGGAANVVKNVRALGGSVAVVGVVGKDFYGEQLKSLLRSAGADTSGIVVDSERVTTRKTRIWVSHRQQVVRVDRENRKQISELLAERILSSLRDKLVECDVLILSDYNKGVLQNGLAAKAVELAREMGKICTANPKPMNVEGFKGADLIALNQSEAEAASGFTFESEDLVTKAGKQMLSDLDLGSLVITRGSVGLSIFCKDKTATVPAIPLEVYDVTGAGDTVITSISLALATGASPIDAARIGNLAGGAAVKKVGVSAVTREEILALSAGYPPDTKS